MLLVTGKHICADKCGRSLVETVRYGPQMSHMYRRRYSILVRDRSKYILYVTSVLGFLKNSLASGERIEIRGFGSFSLHFRPPRIGRNPKTGEAVALSGKHVPHFKPGKDLRERVNMGRDNPIKD